MMSEGPNSLREFPLLDLLDKALSALRFSADGGFLEFELSSARRA